MKPTKLIFVAIGLFFVIGGVTGLALYWEEGRQVPERWVDLAWKGTVQSRVVCLGFQKDGRTLVVTGRDGRVLLIDPVSGRMREPFESNPDEKVFNAKLSPGAEYLALDGLEVLHIPSRTRTPIPPTCVTRCLDFSPDAKYLAISGPYGSKGKVWIWDVRGKKMAKVVVHDQPPSAHYVERVFFSRDGTALATQDDERTIRIWDTETWRLAQMIVNDYDHPGPGALQGWGPDGTSLIGLTRSLQMWDINAGRVQYALKVTAPGLGARIASVALSPNGRLLAYGRTMSIPNGAGYEALIGIWNIESGKRSILVIDAGKASNAAVAFSPDGKMLAAGFSSGAIYVWRIEYPPRQRSLLGIVKGMLSHPKQQPPASPRQSNSRTQDRQ